MMITKKISAFALMMAALTFSVTSCDSDDDSAEPVAEDLITLDKYEVNFGEIAQASPVKNINEKEVILTLTNNSDETLESLDSSIEFPGNAAVNLVFTPVPPGGEIAVPFTFSPGSLEPGVYTGKATLTPSIGDPIEVALEATVVAVTNNKITLSQYSIDFGEVAANKSKNNQEEVVVLTVTNNSDEILTSLGSEASFPGNLNIEILFSPLEPGQSLDVPFKFSPASEEPGDYTGTAKLIPSIGDPIEVALSVTII